MLFGLSEDTVERIRAVFRAHPEIDEVILYGSRAKGDQKPGSDIDLACRGQDLTHAAVNRILCELDELLLPYSIDLADIEAIDNRELLDHINRVGRTFYRRTKE